MFGYLITCVWICFLPVIKGHPCDPNEATQLVNLPHALLNSFRTSISCLSGALGVGHNYTVLQIIQK